MSCNFKPLRFLLLFAIQLVAAQNVSDTVFLVNNNQVPKDGRVYIDPNKMSKFYKRIIDFPKHSRVKKEDELSNRFLPSKWVPVYLYNNQYFVYLPCDTGPNYRMLVSKKSIFMFGMEAYECTINISLKKINDKHFKLGYIDIQYKNTTFLDVYVIDKQRGLAVFRWSNKKTRDEYQLMVEADKIAQFQIIVNECNYSKTKEFDFDKIDFRQILNQQK